MIKEFDDIFNYIGGFGLYQWILFGVVCYVNILYCFILYGQLFLAITPPHWCKPDIDLEELHIRGYDITLEELKNLTIPQKLSDDGYQSCFKYNINITEILDQGFNTPDDNWDIIECNNGWNYNFSGRYYPTISTEMNLVCKDDWKPPLAQSIFYIGSIFGGPIFGWVADNYGRLPVAVSANVLSGLAGLWSAFSGSYVSFSISRFMVGFATDTNYMVIFILGLELVSAKYRTYVANVPITVFLTSALIVLPWISVGIGNWRMLAVALSVPHLLFITLPFFFPESVRWLIDKGNYKKSKKIIEKIAKINDKELPEDFYTNFDNFFNKSQEEKKIVSWWDLLKTPNLRKRFLLLCVMWVAVIVSYDGNVRNIETLGGDFFISFTLIGVMEAPADVINIYLVEKLGRRYTMVLALVFSALSSFVVAALPRADNWYALIVFALMGRFFITICANCGLQYVVEVLPTVARAQGSGLIHTLGGGMTLITPYVVYLSKFFVWAPYTIIGLISLSGGYATLFLPETKGEALPGSLEDGEKAFINQKFIYNPLKIEEKNTKDLEKSSGIQDTKL